MWLTTLLKFKKPAESTVDETDLGPNSRPQEPSMFDFGADGPAEHKRIHADRGS